MTSRDVLLRVFCSKRKSAHIVGQVRPTPSGAALSITTAVGTSNGTVGVERTYELGQETAVGEAWCATCEKRLPFAADELLTRAARGEGRIVLVAEGMHRDPLGVHKQRKP